MAGFNRPAKRHTPLVLIGTPVKGDVVSTNYFDSIFSIQRAGIEFHIHRISGATIVAQARNEILHYFICHQEYTHLFFLDADTGIEGHDLRRMLDYKKGVVGAPVKLTTPDPETGKHHLNVGERISYDLLPPTENTGLFHVEHIGAAAMLIDRKTAETVTEKEPASYMDKGQVIAEVFKPTVFNGKFWGEDYLFCKKAHEAGFNVYVDTKARTSHIGNVKFNNQ